MSKPVAVIIGDIHFTPSTLELATKSLIMAKDKADELNIPLIVNGDTLDSKAIMRGECVNRLLDIVYHITETYVNIGNHDLLNEKGREHTLRFLNNYVDIVSKPISLGASSIYIIPYQNSSEAMQSILDTTPKGSTLIIHQGVQTAYMGHYAQDKTSLPKDAYADFRVIASHYHRAQNIKCGRPRKGGVGLFSYIGNPYTLNFGEANDGPKGFAVLHEDGSLEHVPTNLRKHVVIEKAYDDLNDIHCDKEDLLWLKVSGPRSELAKISKKSILGHSNFKLDLIPTDSAKVDKVEGLTDHQLLDSLIDNLGETNDEKTYLKQLWRELL